MCIISLSVVQQQGLDILAQLQMAASHEQSIPIPLQTSTDKPCVALGLHGSWLGLSWLSSVGLCCFFFTAGYLVCVQQGFLF